MRVRLRVRVAVGLLVALALAGVGVWRLAPRLPEASAEQLVLLRRVQTLRALNARAAEGPLLAPGDLVVSVDEHLAQDLVSSVLPIEADVGRSYRVRIESAVARFEDGLALVRFDGRASAPRATFAQVSLFAGVDRVLLASGGGALRARLTVFAVDAPEVRLAGRRTDVNELVTALGPSGLETLAALLPAIPVPLSLNTAVELPPVQSRIVRIAAARLPLAFAVRDVAVFRGRLWVSLAAATGERAAETEPGGGPELLLRPGDAPSAALDAPSVFSLAARGCSSVRRREQALAEAQAGLVRSHEQEAARFAQRLRRDTLAQQALARPSELAVVLRPALVEALVRNAAASYLRAIDIDLRREVVRKAGEERRRTPIGRRTVGRWHAKVRLDGVRGTAHVEPPQVRLGAGNSVSLAVPVRVPATPASVSVSFSWRSSGVAKLVCRDFDLERRVSGTLLPLRAVVSGGFVLSAQRDAVIARPFLDDPKLHLEAELSDESWAGVRDAIATQDTLLRCGLGLDPDAVVLQLRQLVARGFDVRLPRELLQPVRLPAQFTSAVDVGGRSVDLAVQASGTQVTGEGLWARARMHATTGPAGRVVSD